MKFKKIISLLLSILLVFVVSACDKGDNGGKGDATTSSGSSSNLKVTPISSIKGEGEKEGVVFVGDDSYVTPERMHKLNGEHTSKSDEEALALRDEITNAKDNIKVEGNTYYISNNGDDTNDGKTPQTAWKSIKALSVHRNTIRSGDAVLFQRGGIYRGRFAVTSGVTYGAYGEGPKPCIYGATTNSANADWRRTSIENIYALYLNSTDIGSIVYNHGEHYSTKILTSVWDLRNDFEFYHDLKKSILYVYSSKGNPRDLYYDIELCENVHIITVNASVKDVTIDNLTIKYGGAHGISCKSLVDNITITNCEIAWIGGSVHSGETRWGNAIEFYGGVSNSTVSNNWIYQCYDTGITPQYGYYSPEVVNNLAVTANLIEYCTWSFEVWWSIKDRNTNQYFDNPDVKMVNITVSDNIMRFAGYGFGKQRPDNERIGHFISNVQAFNRAENFVVKNNIFDTSARQLVFYQAHNEEWLPKFEGNTYIADDGITIFYLKNIATVIADAAAESGAKKIDKTATVILK